MTSYLWEQNEFYEDLEETLSDSAIHSINIATAYISLGEAKHLFELTNELDLEKKNIQI